MNFKILNTLGPSFDSEAKKILESKYKIDDFSGSQTELENLITEYDVVVCGIKYNFNEKILNKVKKLKIIATVTTGLDHINLSITESKNIKVLSLKEEKDFLKTITSTAELALGLMINLSRYIIDASNSVQNYEWNREKYNGHSLYGKTLGILGLGRLGEIMANYGKTLGMNVIFHDPYKESSSYKKVSIIELFKNSDVISIHTHLEDSTVNFVNKELLDKTKNNLLIVNTARGGIVNEKDILEALKNKKIAGYATDVLADELNFSKNFSKNPLVEYSKNNCNLIITPHIGGMTHESRKFTDIFMANKIVDFVDKNLQ